ncbi:MAG TPA: hypothetical protein VFV34_27010 [Blastocatellia bacterium]|nr:hypothetical protein [Blastocatellia bacterium]
MKDRIKWLLVGLGFAVGLQVIISLLFTGVAYYAAGSSASIGQDLVLVVALGLVFGAFLIGGFVVGVVSEELRLLDAFIVALLGVSLSAAVYLGLPHGNKAQFVTGYMLDDVGRTALFAGLAIAAALIGAYWGWHVTVPREGVLDRVALLTGLIGTFVGPIVLLSVGGTDPTNTGKPNLPWYFVAIFLAAVLVIVGAGFLMFTRESKHDDDISISPEHHKEPVKSRAAGGGN